MKVAYIFWFELFVSASNDHFLKSRLRREEGGGRMVKWNRKRREKGREREREEWEGGIERERTRGERRKNDETRWERGPQYPPFLPHYFVGEVLQVLQSQLLADDLQVSHRVYVTLHMRHIVIFKCPWKITKILENEAISPWYLMLPTSSFSRNNG